MVRTPRARSRESSCFRRDPPSSTNERSDTISPSFQVEEVRLDALVGGDGESGDVVLPRREGLDRALPARLRIGLAQEPVGGEIVDRDGNHEPAVAVALAARSCASRSSDVVGQLRFLHVPAGAEQLAGRGVASRGPRRRSAEGRESRAWSRARRAGAGHDPAADDRDGPRSGGRASRTAAWRRSGRRPGRGPRTRPCSCCTRPAGRGSIA